MSKQMDCKFRACHSSSSSKAGDIESSTKHKCKTTDPETQHSDSVNHEVHCHGMCHIFLLSKSSFDHSEPRLHEHYKETCDQGPHDIDGNLIMTICCTNRLYCRCQFANMGANGGNACILGIGNGIKDFYCHSINIGECSCFCTSRILCQYWNHHEKAYNDCQKCKNRLKSFYISLSEMMHVD